MELIFRALIKVEQASDNLFVNTNEKFMDVRGEDGLIRNENEVKRPKKINTGE